MCTSAPEYFTVEQDINSEGEFRLSSPPELPLGTLKQHRRLVRKDMAYKCAKQLRATELFPWEHFIKCSRYGEARRIGRGLSRIYAFGEIS